jgi:ElaB/YqjD/DUF883 family membrane-anchored ribosome-binding protein
MKAENTIKSSASDVASKVRNGVDMAQDKIEESVDSLSSRLGSLEELWKEYGDLMIKNAKELGTAAEKQVRANPLAAFGIAFGAGIVLARLLRR